MKPVLLSPEAQIELSEAGTRLEEGAASYAQAFRLDFAERVEQIRKHPGIGSEVRAPYRRWSIPRFHYDLIYREAQTAIVIVAIAHHHRAPGYWAPRIETDEVQEPTERAAIRAAWDGEIRRRLAEYESGAVETIPADQMMAELRARIASRQQ